jgi:hypothetical protein
MELYSVEVTCLILLSFGHLDIWTFGVSTVISEPARTNFVGKAKHAQAKASIENHRSFPGVSRPRGFRPAGIPPFFPFCAAFFYPLIINALLNYVNGFQI